jgi:type I restriction enzyme S subunit
VKWLGLIPEHWEKTRLKFTSKKIVDGTHFTPTYKDEGVPFVTVKNLTNGKEISLDDCKYISNDEHKKLSRRANAEYGDVLITKDGTLGTARINNIKEEFSIFISVALKNQKEIKLIIFS